MRKFTLVISTLLLLLVLLACADEPKVSITLLLSLGLLAYVNKPKVIREDIIEERNDVEIVETEEDVDLDVVEQVGDVDSSDEEVEDDIIIQGAF